MSQRLPRGEIVWVRFSPGEGSEAQKMRPGIVVSNDGVNASATRYSRGVITVVPLTSARVVPLAHQVAISQEASGLSRDSVAQVEQLRAVDISRVHPTGRRVDTRVIALLDAALRVHLGLA